MKKDDDDINEYVPSILNPRSLKKSNCDLTLTQNSIVSCRSLSLKRTNANGISNQVLNKVHNNGEPVKKKSVLEYKNKTPLVSNKPAQVRSLISAVEELNPILDKENSKNLENQLKSNTNIDKIFKWKSLCLSGIEDLSTVLVRNVQNSSSLSFEDIDIPPTLHETENNNHSLISLSSATDLNDSNVSSSESTIHYEITERPVISVSFGVNNCETINLSTKNSNIKNIEITHKNNATDVDCNIVESSILSLESTTDENMNELSPSPPKKLAVAVNLEIKNEKQAANDSENSKLLFLNTDDIGKLSHVIVQPPNYKLVKRQISDHRKFTKNGKRNSIKYNNGKILHVDNLKQKRIDSYFVRGTDVTACDGTVYGVKRNENGEEMSKVSGVAVGVKIEARGSGRSKGDSPSTPRSAMLPVRELQRERSHSNRPNSSEAKPCRSVGQQSIGWPTVKSCNSRPDSGRPNLNEESAQFLVPLKSKKNVTSKNIPLFKIVSGTNFAVDAFSHGEIPNVTNYFLTHFHSDHYSGLKKTFNKTLFCTKITGDLCMTRLGVNPKCIQVLNYDVTVVIDEVEVTALDANHCPGAMMLVFTLPNGKTMLHTGDFRASPLMESFPIFWNKDINIIYLDTTYCNPRYDFPSQEQSLEMALYILRQKKLALERVKKNFSSVLIVCGTYTIGKEKFFLGMARRVGCSVWACPEKDRILQIVEGRSFGHAPPQSCQLHVMPMRDLTLEKLQGYLETMQGTFSEVVAFKPSGWENGRNSSTQKDNVVIHGIPYSEHSSFSELTRFVKFLKPKQVVPTVEISGDINIVQKYFPCPLVFNTESTHNQSKMTDFYEMNNRPQVSVIK